jgi:hypothetical protein
MTDVYLLWHVDERGADTGSKLLGVFSSEDNARAWQEAATALPGFRDAPDRFLLDRQTIDERLWLEGYEP